MKTIGRIMTIVAVVVTLVTASCKKEDPIIPLNAVMGGTWVYEEKDGTDGGSMTLRETLTFTSATDCKRVKSRRTLLMNKKEEFDLTYIFDGEIGTLTGLYNIYTTPMDFLFRYDSVSDKLTVWCGMDSTVTGEKRFVYYREK